MLKVETIEIYGPYLDPSAKRIDGIGVIVDLQAKRPASWDEDLRTYQPVFPGTYTRLEKVVAAVLDVWRYLRSGSPLFSIQDSRARARIPESDRRVVFQDRFELR